jgi:ABC-type glycerol-3-phosphate transport system substrate-binding protein
LVIFYNQSWAEELGYSTPPDTPFNFRLQACAAAEESNQDANPDNNNSGLIVTANPSALLSWIYAFGGDVTLPQGKGYRFETPEAERALNFLKGLQDSHCAWSFNGVDAAAEFAARRGLFYIDTLASLPALRAAFKAAGNSDTWAVIPFPSAADGAVLDAFGPSLLMPQSSPEEQLAAWLLIKWLVDPHNQALWVERGPFLPTRASTIDYLESALKGDPQYAQALELLPFARSEPAYASWYMVRWALLDLQEQLLSTDLDEEDVPGLLENLDQVALEIHTQMR